MSRSLTQVCTSPWRFSSGIDSSFSSRSYTVWFSHAVSSMVIKVSISATLFISASLDDDVALMRHALPFLVIGAHVGGELCLAHVHHVHAHAAIALAHRFDGTCSSFRFAWRMRSSIARWFDEPLPADAMLIRPGLDRASEKYSWNEETGVLGATVSTIGTDWIGPMATRSLSGS